MKIYIKNICIYGTTTCFFLILFHYLIKSRPSVQFILNLIIRFSGRVHNFGVGFCGTEKWGYGRWLWITHDPLAMNSYDVDNIKRRVKADCVCLCNKGRKNINDPLLLFFSCFWDEGEGVFKDY